MNQAERIQTSIINGLEKKALVWMAKRMPRWVTSDMLTVVGTIGAMIVALGFVLSDKNVNWLWLSSLGLVINWFGDSLDGTIARVHNTQRPVYGYYIDHVMDLVNEGFMFVGCGLSPFMRLDFALLAYALYLMLTVNVSINAHLRGEFKLTYIKLGPTEFRLIIVIMNTLLIALPALRNFSNILQISIWTLEMSVLDYVAVAIIIIMAIIFLTTMISDARYYAKQDPPKKRDR